MTEEEKKRQQELQTEAAPAATTGTVQPAPDYGAQLTSLYSNITGKQPFSYDVNGDALYQQYKDRYTQNAKQSMKDTLGQAATLTGGYGSSYSNIAGQQAYDRQMMGLTDKIPELQQQAYQRYQDDWSGLLQQYNITANAEQQGYDRQQDAYNQLANLISTTGYGANEDDLTKSGMNAEQANALKQSWIVAHPIDAYRNGDIDAEGYRQITGAYPPGYVDPNAYYSYGGDSTKPKSLVDIADSAMRNGNGNYDARQAVLKEISNAKPGTYSHEDYTAAMKQIEKYL